MLFFLVAKAVMGKNNGDGRRTNVELHRDEDERHLERMGRRGDI